MSDSTTTGSGPSILSTATGSGTSVLKGLQKINLGLQEVAKILDAIEQATLSSKGMIAKPEPSGSEECKECEAFVQAKVIGAQIGEISTIETQLKIIFAKMMELKRTHALKYNQYILSIKKANLAFNTLAFHREKNPLLNAQ